MIAITHPVPYEEKSRVLTLVHDFKNLLSVINECVNLALRVTPKESQVVEYLESIQEAGVRSNVLIQQMMLFGHKKSIPSTPKKDKTSTYSVAQKIIRVLQHFFGHFINIESSIAPDLWNISITADHLNQVLINLCANARDAVEANLCCSKTVFITFDNFMGSPKQKFPNGRYIKITVQDKGMGMSNDVKNHIFEPFFTTKPIGHGNGLGLASVNQIIKYYNGFIEVQSKKGYGTLFSIFLPTKPSTSNATSQAVSEIYPVKNCYLSLDKPITELLTPCLLKNEWQVHTKNTYHPRAITISHHPNADICIPKKFSAHNKIQHPYALAQIIKVLNQIN